jgi:hypothetical protein
VTVLGKINKDFLYNGIYQVTMPRGLGVFSRIGKHIEGVYKPFL